MSGDRTIRGRAAVVGVAQVHHRRGEGPDGELSMTLRTIVAACADAGIAPREVDGFVSYAESTVSGDVLGAALGIAELRWSGLVWGGGGGGAAAAVQQAAVAIATGQSECVVVTRAVSHREEDRLGYSGYQFPDRYRAHGIGSPAQVCALRTQRMLEHDGVPREALRNLVLADYHHAQSNPSAQAHGRPLDAATYDASRWIVEPFHLYDCSRESDGAVALLVVSADRARELRQAPAYVLGCAQGAPGGYAALGENDEPYTSAGFGAHAGGPGVAQRLWASAGLGPSDVDVVQVYENFSGPAVAALIDHGLCPPGPEAGPAMRLEDLLAPAGRLPVNTSGGNIADSFVHGLGLAVEAVRQVRGTSVNQIPGAKVSLFIGGPMAPVVGSILLGAGSMV